MYRGTLKPSEILMSHTATPPFFLGYVLNGVEDHDDGIMPIAYGATHAEAQSRALVTATTQGLVEKRDSQSYIGVQEHTDLTPAERTSVTEAIDAACSGTVH